MHFNVLNPVNLCSINWWCWLKLIAYHICVRPYQVILIFWKLVILEVVVCICVLTGLGIVSLFLNFHKAIPYVYQREFGGHNEVFYVLVSGQLWPLVVFDVRHFCVPLYSFFCRRKHFEQVLWFHVANQALTPEQRFTWAYWFSFFFLLRINSLFTKLVGTFFVEVPIYKVLLEHVEEVVDYFWFLFVCWLALHSKIKIISIY